MFFLPQEPIGLSLVQSSKPDLPLFHHWLSSPLTPPLHLFLPLDPVPNAAPASPYLNPGPAHVPCLCPWTHSGAVGLKASPWNPKQRPFPFLFPSGLQTSGVCVCLCVLCACTAEPLPCGDAVRRLQHSSTTILCNMPVKDGRAEEMCYGAH